MPTPCIPRVIGLYGIPGCGKTFLLEKLKNELGESEFQYFEGSEEIDYVTSGGLDAFNIKSKCSNSGKVGLVTGHYMFWSQETERGLRVWTGNDLNTYTHIVYRRREDHKRSREHLSIADLNCWQATEVNELRELCYQRRILFTTVHPNLEGKISKLLLDFQAHSEGYNNAIARQHLERTLATQYDELQTVLFFDGDKTLTPENTGDIFWEKVIFSVVSPLHKLFSSPMGYSYTAFRQAMLLYEEEANDKEFETFCGEVSRQVPLYPQMLPLLRRVGRYNHIRPVIVTCGLRRVWEMIVVVAAVVQDKAVSGCGLLKALARTAEFTVVALRLSHNKYTGRGGTDTGNRLFNTA